MSDSDLSRALLIVDDEKDILDIIEDQLSVLGISIHRAENGVEAMQMLSQRHIDAVLSDILMPGKNGIQLLAELRSRCIDIPFVFLTGHGNRDNVLDALRLGACDFLEKPFQRAQLIDIVSRAVDIGVRKHRVENQIIQLAPENGDLAQQRKQIALLQVVNHAKHKRSA